MSIDALVHYLEGLGPLSEAFRTALIKELTLLSLPKQYELLKAPQVASHAYYLSKGSALCYTFVDGKKQIEGFWKADQLIFSARSFFEQVPSVEFIELTSASVVYCISYTSTMRLLDAYPEAHVLYRMVMNRYYEQCRQTIRDLQSLSAVQRHTKLIRDYPGLEQVVSQEVIASYLGITPQSLSRIKRMHL